MLLLDSTNGASPPAGCDLDVAAGLRCLTQHQCGVVTRDQLATLGVSYRKLDAQVRGRRWSAMGPNGIVLHNATPTGQGVVLHESRRLRPEDVVHRRDLPRHRGGALRD